MILNPRGIKKRIKDRWLWGWIKCWLHPPLKCAVGLENGNGIHSQREEKKMLHKQAEHAKAKGDGKIRNGQTAKMRLLHLVCTGPDEIIKPHLTVRYSYTETLKYTRRIYR